LDKTASERFIYHLSKMYILWTIEVTGAGSSFEYDNSTS
jgi:hypothetical protein